MGQEVLYDSNIEDIVTFDLDPVIQHGHAQDLVFHIPILLFHNTYS